MPLSCLDPLELKKETVFKTIAILMVANNNDFKNIRKKKSSNITTTITTTTTTNNSHNSGHNVEVKQLPYCSTGL